MTKYIDFEAIKADFNMIDAIAMLKLKGRFKNHQWRGECPIHGGDRGLVISPQQGEHGAFNCNKHGKGGWDAISLVAHIMACRQYAAAQAITEYLDADTSTVTGTSKGTVPTKEVVKETQKLQPLAHLVFDHEEVEELGLDAETAEELGVGYAKRGIMAGRIVWPLYRDGALAGYIGWSPKHENFKLPNNLKASEEDDEKIVAFPNRA